MLALYLLFRALTRDCGQLLASSERMARVPPLRVPATCIVGVAGMAITRAAFGAEPNDGVVSVSEASADWLPDQKRVPVVHTLLPASRQVGSLVVEQLLSIERECAQGSGGGRSVP
jgi:hypothetical protein